MNYRSVNEMDMILRNNLDLIPRDVELIVGIPRSGMLPATLLSLYLNLPLTDSMTLLSGSGHAASSRNYRIKGKNSTNINDYKKILVIDDSCNEGISISEVRQAIEAIPDCETKVIYACVYASEKAVSYVDIYFEIVPQIRVFEWNIMNHLIISQACIDMDGVLCVDPTDEENDDGEKYINFILNAAPLWIPKFKIGAIVTSRLEKYRYYTEKWLADHGVEYDKLIMLDLPDKWARIRMGAHAKFKAEIYSGIRNAVLFIESDGGQAKYISSATGKAVYCVSDNSFYAENRGVEKYLEVKVSANEHSEKITGIINKLTSLANHLDDNELGTTIIDGLISGWETVIVDMSSVFSTYSCRELKDMNSELIRYRYENDYDNCCKILKDMQKMGVNILREETKKKILSAASNVSDIAWSRELEYIRSILTEGLLISDVISEEYKNEILYLKSINTLKMYPYKWTEEYQEEDVMVHAHETGMKYILHNNRPLFFPPHSDEMVRREYNQLIMEQDIRSPHRYFDDKCDFREGDIFIDVGAAEGIISLDILDKADRIILIESDDKWISTLNETFKEYRDKVEIIDKYAGSEDTEQCITLDSLMGDCHGKRIFIKIDIEGMELEALNGARALLKNNYCNVSCAVYHTQSQEKEIEDFFDMIGYRNYASEGYVLFIYGYGELKNGKYERIAPPYFRRAIVRAISQKSV